MPLRKAVGDNLDMEACRATSKRGKRLASDSTMLQPKTPCRPWKNFLCRGSGAATEQEIYKMGRRQWDEKGQDGVRLHG